MDEFKSKSYLNAHAALSEKLDFQSFNLAIDLIKNKYDSGNKIFTCGNGGSSHTASHYITDWNKMVYLATGRMFRGISLCDNVGVITAYSNDIGYEEIFCGQLKSMMDKGDLVIGISGSGNSKNVINAIEYANANGADTLAIVGYDGGALKKIAKKNVWVPSFDMQLCEDIHLMFGHMVMKSLCSSKIES
jgi:D-sedoheptulose 7-phosphate isomerase